MSITIACHACKKRYAVPDTMAGKRIHCPGCKQPVQVPAAQPVPVAAPTMAPPPPPPPAPADPNAPRPQYQDVPNIYCHTTCNMDTHISDDIVAMIVCDPFRPILSTPCAGCQRHVPLSEVAWTETKENVAEFRARLRREMPQQLLLLRLVGGPLGLAILALLLALVASTQNPVPAALGAFVIGGVLGYFFTGFLFQMFRNPRDAVR